jgi:hypothetical protein
MVQAAGRRPFTAEASFRFQVNPCGISEEQNLTGMDFSPSTSAFFCIIPSLIHTHQYQYYHHHHHHHRESDYYLGASNRPFKPHGILGRSDLCSYVK